MNPTDYGTILAKELFDTYTRYIVNNGPRNYKIDVSLDSLVNKVTFLGPTDLQWIDYKIDSDIFKREIGKSVFYFIGGEKVLRKNYLMLNPLINWLQIKN